MEYKRILLKLSGESLADQNKFGISNKKILEYCQEIESVVNQGIELALVIGGGNIFRGISVSERGMDRVSADYVGMMATIMNSVALQSELEKIGCVTRVMSALSVTQLAEPYIRRRATRHLEKNRIVIFAGGTGNPYFTTDTAAALRGTEIGADIIIKGTKVDGIFSSDPMKDKNAKKYDNLTFKEVIEKELRVMDMTAITLCKENNIPIIVLNIGDDSLNYLMENKKTGTLVS